MSVGLGIRHRMYSGVRFRIRIRMRIRISLMSRIRSNSHVRRCIRIRVRPILVNSPIRTLSIINRLSRRVCISMCRGVCMCTCRGLILSPNTRIRRSLAIRISTRVSLIIT